MGEIVRFVPQSERERARLIQEARAIYDSIFPPADPIREQHDKAHRSESNRLARTRLGIMKFVTCLLAAALLLAGVGASHAAVRIADDRGGQIGSYITKFQRLRSSGQSVIIDGLCASACTIVLGAVPHDKICVTSRAALGFHAAYDFGINGRTFTNREATMMLYSMYPTRVQRWIAARGGLTPQMIFLSGQQLQAMYQPCYSMR
jgi:hypothetical protein